jgi:hypothetical protein
MKGSSTAAPLIGKIAFALARFPPTPLLIGWSHVPAIGPMAMADTADSKFTCRNRKIFAGAIAFVCLPPPPFCFTVRSSGTDDTRM